MSGTTQVGCFLIAVATVVAVLTLLPLGAGMIMLVLAGIGLLVGLVCLHAGLVADLSRRDPRADPGWSTRLRSLQRGGYVPRDG